MLTVSELFIYPIKSLGGISVQQAQLTDRGFALDRRWMLVNDNNEFLSQREIPQMALLQCSIHDEQVLITHKISQEAFSFHLQEHGSERFQATVWAGSCDVVLVSEQANKWFSNMLGIHCRLVYMPEDSTRKVDEDYAINDDIASLSDGFPLTIIGQSSLDDLNARLEEKLGMDRFRPNIIFSGGVPYQEDTMNHFRINHIDLYGVKPCARCPITTTSQQTAERSKEPLKTLAAYRQLNNKVYFGQNVLFKGKGLISVGDRIEFT